MLPQHSVFGRTIFVDVTLKLHSPAGGEAFRQRLDEEELAPHHRFVDAKILCGMVDAMLDDSFPMGILNR
jgi:hypothetical protein